MRKLQITPEAYVAEIAMRRKRHLLLEGSDDEAFFILIRNRLQQKDSSLSSEKLNSLKSIVIRTAERIEGELGNRAKIEKICDLILQKRPDIRNKFLGYVDREFREFEYGNSLQDQLKTHKIHNRLIWSRGHSIENYFFDIAVWREAFNEYLVSRFYPEAFEIFESRFDHILRIACALSLAGLSEDLLRVIADSLAWECVDITSTSIKINLDEWQKKLKKNSKLDQNRIDNLIRKFETYLAMIEQNDLEVARWLCHGHIGFNFMFSVYGKCLYEVASSDEHIDPKKEADKVNKNKDTRFPKVANAWIRNQFLEYPDHDLQDFPIKCFWFLMENIE